MQWKRRVKVEEMKFMGAIADVDEDEVQQRKMLLEQMQLRNRHLIEKLKNNGYQIHTQINPETINEVEVRSRASSVGKVEVSAKAPPSVKSQVGVKKPAMSNFSRGTLSEAGSHVLNDKLTVRSLGSTIRTTTTTKERLADIERQLQEEIEKRKQAEMKLKLLKREAGL